MSDRFSPRWAMTRRKASEAVEAGAQLGEQSRREAQLQHAAGQGDAEQRPFVPLRQLYVGDGRPRVDVVQGVVEETDADGGDVVTVKDHVFRTFRPLERDAYAAFRAALKSDLAHAGGSDGEPAAPQGAAS